MQAMIFDFDGVIVNSEPIHLSGFQKVLTPLGIEMTEDAYYGKYLGLDDRDCLAAAAADAGRHLQADQIAELTAEKTRFVQQTYADSIAPMPGAVELIRAAHSAGVPLAICSGALRDEITLAAGTVGVLECFRAIVPAEDVRHGKPDPEGYLLARDRLVEAGGEEISPAGCIVVEDAPAGIDAAHGAGMKVLAVTHSYPRGALAAADRVVETLTGVTLQELDRIVQE